jgi:hypothetical protein
MKAELMEQCCGRCALLAAALLTTLAFLTPAQAQSKRNGLVGTRAPNFRLQGVYDETYTLDQFKGHILVMQFGSSW